MPRETIEYKVENAKNAKSCNSSKKRREPKNDFRKEKIKKEFDDTTKKSVGEVFHRKSKRRRLARDIFLVFEEEPSSRRTRTNKKQTKPKFGHLKLDDNTRPKGLLRDIKNEPKCCLNNSNVSVNAKLTQGTSIVNSNSNTHRASKKKEKTLKLQSIATSVGNSVNSGYGNNFNNIKSLKISTLDSQSCTLSKETKLIAKINPIFLWVKQDDTRIIEVRCEDYDKRNRIRITKTSNGWRAIPRSDPTTSRVLNFYSTPLMKVKRENHIHEAKDINSKNENNDVIRSDFLTPYISPERIVHKADKVYNPLAINNVKLKAKNRNLKKFRTKCPSEKALKKFNTDMTAYSEAPTAKLDGTCNASSTDVHDFPMQADVELLSKINKKTPEIDLQTTETIGYFSPHSIRNIAEELETDITSINSNSVIDDTKNSYQTECEKEFSFHLCPKTGLFLPNEISFAVFQDESNKRCDDQEASVAKISFLSTSKEEFNTEMEKVNAEPKIHISDENTESLEANTKNLKDLLDDADLLQNCDENANSGADLIDKLVKKSCENNLIQSNEITKATTDQMHQKNLRGTNEMVVQLIADVSDLPKCLSFNEAGEIEGLNGDLFQSHTYMEAFDKQSSNYLLETQDVLHLSSSVEEASQLPQKVQGENIDPTIGIDSVHSVSKIEDSPKDLSYKKREEVCPPSESRSQCAVTSSSDVIKSQAEEPSVASSSESLKSLILEQFMKLNALTTQHQKEPKDLEKQGNSDLSTGESIYNSNTAQSSNFIETVIIEDDDENESDNEYEEPLMKRLRLKKHNPINKNVEKLSLIDKDPDPLTQLRLLIGNTQWKVPDPILVPKDRLNAVLASPAREIPLLITTRPELRLPEAFAYPEIIQNPNILVISMSQLEAILKNEREVENSKALKSMQRNANQQLSGESLECHLTKRVNGLKSQSAIHHLQQPKNILTNDNIIQDPNSITTENSGVSDMSSKIGQESDKISHMDSLHTSDLNSGAMAVLNQMLWLPYFGKISPNIELSKKNSVPAHEKYLNAVPFCNTQPNEKNLDEFFKHTDHNKISGSPISYTGLQSFRQQFKTSEELLLFQQIVQRQMESVLQLNQLQSESSQIMAPVVVVPSVEKSKSKIESLSNLKEQRQQKVIFPNEQKNIPVCKNQTNNCDSNTPVLENLYNLRSSVAGRHSIESEQYSSKSQTQLTDNKPRLTCKSLSNLLKPKHNMVPSSSSTSIPGVENLPSDFLKSVNEIKRSTDYTANDSFTEEKLKLLSNASMASSFSTSCTNSNSINESNSKLPRKGDKTFANISSNIDAPLVPVDTKTPLWHPLFGSNTKTSYCSPWQWTTVTSIGE